MGLAFLWEALDRRVRTDEEVERILGVPLLARLAEPDRELQKRDGVVMLTDPYGVHAEAYRQLRTNVEFANLAQSA